MLGLDESPESLLHLPPLLLGGRGEPGGALVLDGQRATPDVHLQLVRHLQVVVLVFAVGVVHDVGHGQPGQQDQLNEDLGKCAQMEVVNDASMLSEFLFGEVWL